MNSGYQNQKDPHQNGFKWCGIAKLRKITLWTHLAERQNDSLRLPVAIRLCLRIRWEEVILWLWKSRLINMSTILKLSIVKLNLWFFEISDSMLQNHRSRASPRRGRRSHGTDRQTDAQRNNPLWAQPSRDRHENKRHVCPGSWKRDARVWYPAFCAGDQVSC